MPSPCAVALLTQINDMVLRGPQYQPSEWLPLSYPSLLVTTATADQPTASWSTMIESPVDVTVDVVCEAPHWLLSATRLRWARASPLRSSAMVLWSRAVASGSMVLECPWSFFAVLAAVLLEGQ